MKIERGDHQGLPIVSKHVKMEEVQHMQAMTTHMQGQIVQEKRWGLISEPRELCHTSLPSVYYIQVTMTV